MKFKKLERRNNTAPTLETLHLQVLAARRADGTMVRVLVGEMVRPGTKERLKSGLLF